jgi:hypothetical protein
MAPIRCAETSIKDYYSTLRYTPEERRSYTKLLGVTLPIRLYCLCIDRLEPSFLLRFPKNLAHWQNTERVNSTSCIHACDKVRRVFADIH